MSENTKRIIERWVIPGLLAVALVAVSIFAAGQRALAMSYKGQTESMYRSAFGELSDDLYDMENTLSKLLVVNSPAQYILLLDDVWRLSGSAVGHMSRVPASHVDTSELNSFLVRVGDYSRALSKKAVGGKMLSDGDVEVISELRDSCAALAADYGERYESGDTPSAAAGAEGYFAQSEGGKDNDSISEFPTLIYDGPFSESSEKLEAKGVDGENVSEEQARGVAEALAGMTLSPSGMTEGEIRAYNFSYSDEGGGWAEAAITERGGHVLWFMRSASGAKEGKPDESEAARYRDAALAALEAMGYANMKATYAQYYAGTALINCAATQGDTILYSDLVKVWIDRETLALAGVDARNYLFSHVERELPAPAVSLEEAEALLSGRLEVKDRALALIPLTPETERLCYEFKCGLGQEAYIVYIDVLTGEEAQIFKIIDSEDGQLVL